ncbi:GGDEF-domain containing protein [Domibacillus enclensis]|uniref:Diguanylate cyclase (GGDEF) domain-containing protein n=1 Tax=Domibacillus enclensis TaxID=1017273 RepID=A0A1N6X1J9_9BACI|nr:GGDEF-domain containing protein [Domibacillus enclensis]SIQ96244.1 diguanylate cyclase (GGDEF) domain-containing protein [Domibacillus enclensis]
MINLTILFFILIPSVITFLFLSKRKIVSRLAHTDHLTGLPNRRKLEPFIQDRTIPLRLPVAVVVIDIDNFNWVNERYGYESGNALIVEFAQRLAFLAPKNSLVARIEGNKFALAIPGTYSRQEIQTMLSEQFSPLQNLFHVYGEPVHLTFSAGVALAPVDGLDCHTLLLHAERALRHVKHHGKNDIVLYHPSFQQQDFERQLAMSFQSALQNGEFYLCYQPKFNLRTNSIDSAEVLVRWDSPIHGAVSPAVFIPAAEKNGFIFDLTKWILEESCRQMHHWVQTDHPIKRIAVNISAPLFLSDRLPEMISKILKDFHLPASHLELEITETAIMEHFDEAFQIIALLKKKGIAISLDDFGTGVSSLTYVKKLPIDTLKIDKSFIDGVHTSFEDKALVEMIIQLAKLFKLSVVAEGVEKQEQLNVLKKLGCDSIQGYLISRPERPEALSLYKDRSKYGS